jgi:hypothetical protein
MRLWKLFPKPKNRKRRTTIHHRIIVAHLIIILRRLIFPSLVTTNENVS